MALRSACLPETSQELQRNHKLVALVHHPLALESGISAQDAAAFRASERAALASARAIIATSRATVRVLADGLRRRARPRQRGRTRHRSRRGRAAGRERHRCVAGRRRGGAAQGIRPSRRRACDAEGFVLAARHRGRQEPRSRDRAKIAGRDRPPRSRRRAYAWRARYRAKSFRRSMRAPTSSCSRRVSRATGWPIRRRWPTACR